LLRKKGNQNPNQMKALASSLLLFYCIMAAAQDSKSLTTVAFNSDQPINFFSINTNYSPKLDKSEINLKLPSIYAHGEFKSKDQWLMPLQDLDFICPPGSNQINGFIGFQSVNTLNLFNSKAVNRFTFDAMGNLVNTELTFGGF
jgi:hypothetical protein